MTNFISILVNAIIYVCLTFIGFICIHSVLSIVGCLLTAYTFQTCFESSLIVPSILVTIISFALSCAADEDAKSKY